MGKDRRIVSIAVKGNSGTMTKEGAAEGLGWAATWPVPISGRKVGQHLKPIILDHR